MARPSRIPGGTRRDRHSGARTPRRGPIDVAILDVNLPDVSGYEISEAIRANPASEWIPVVHVSATAIEADDRSEGLLRGADAYLTEPVEPRELLAIIASLLRRAHVRQETLRTSAAAGAQRRERRCPSRRSNERNIFEAAALGASIIAGTAPPCWSPDTGRRR